MFEVWGGGDDGDEDDEDAGGHSFVQTLISCHH